MTTTPQSIHPQTILLSTFGRAEDECAAMCIINYLSAHNLPWETEFTYSSFSGWAATSGFGINELYLMMAAMEGGLEAFVVAGLNGLIESGHMSREDREGRTHLQLNQSFVVALT